MNQQYHQVMNRRQMLAQPSSASNQGAAQVSFYQPHQQSDLAGQAVAQSYGAPPSAAQQNVRSNYPSQATNLNSGGGGIDMMAREAGGRKTTGKSRSGVRPSSATVAGQAGRFLSNQQSRRKYAAGQTTGGQSGQSQMISSQLDQISYSYQQAPSQQPIHQPMMNNLLHQSSNKALNAAQFQQMQNINTIPQLGMGVSPNQFASHRNSNQMLSSQPAAQKPPFAGGRKRTRPQSAARNQMQPAKALQSVTNFTYQKAKQNLNQKAYLPESLKNTDKEKLYEEKISLKKELNEMIIENQQLRTQLQSQQGHIKKKDEMVQQVMRQVFHPTAAQNSGGEGFLEEFHNREIQHAGQGKAAGFAKGLGSRTKTAAAKIVKNQNLLANKDSLITSLKLKMKEVSELCIQKEKELQDLKRTLKFTKIKEYEAELALNVQESQRLRNLLEREMRKPRVDPRLFQALKQQNSQFHHLIQNQQNPQPNQAMLVANCEKLSQKLIGQMKKFAKLKEARKRIREKNQRLEKKVLVLNSKLSQFAGGPRARPGHGRRASPGITGDSETRQSQAISRQLIERLLAKMHERGIEISEEELAEMQQPFQQDPSDEEERNRMDAFAGQEDATLDPAKPMMATMDLIVTFGAKNQSQRPMKRQMPGAQVESFDHLKETLRKEFEISEVDQFQINLVSRDGSVRELSGANWDQVRGASQTNQIELAIQLLGQDNAGEEDEASDYDDNDFEEVAPAEKVFLDAVRPTSVKKYFDELRLILQIKNVKRDDALKYILHGVRDPDTGKKIKKVSLACFAKQLSAPTVIGLPSDVSMKMAKYLIEQPNEEGKVEQMDDREYKGQTHAQAVSIRRKDLQEKLLSNIQEYMLYNGLAVTSMLSQLQGLLEDHRADLAGELEDQDYDDEGTAPMPDIFKAMKFVDLFPDSWDPELRDFLHFLAMRHSKSLEEVVYKELVKVFEEDYSFIEDKRTQWLDADANSGQAYEPSSDEGELESDRLPLKLDDANDDGSQEDGRASGIADELDQNSYQNELLEKVDEILMQIVQKLPPSQKIRSLTELVAPYLVPIYDQQQGQSWIISEEDFLGFLLGSDENQLGLELDENHVGCLLHLLVQEDDEGGDEAGEEQSQNKFILFGEFIDLVKTYMTKELIMQQSKSLGINYDILSRAAVEFLFQVRSSLMHDNNQNINENSADEEENFGTPGGGGSERKQKDVPAHIREIFSRIIQRKSISNAGKGSKKSGTVEVIDFDQMLDALARRLGTQYPDPQAQEELKYLMCLDYKYLEMVKLAKFDQVMHDLDYISIDLLRQAHDRSLDRQRAVALGNLKQIRESQLSKLKRLQAKKSAMNKAQRGGAEPPRAQQQQQEVAPEIYGTSSHQVEFQGVSAGPTQSTTQAKKRKRPDDKKQNFAKKLGNRRGEFSNDMSVQQEMGGNQMGADRGPRGGEKAILPKQHQAKYDRDFRDGTRGAVGVGQNAASPVGAGKERYGPSNNQSQKMQPGTYDGERHEQVDLGIDSEIDVEPNQSNQDSEIEDRVGDSQARNLYPRARDDFDNIDVHLDTDINNRDKTNQQKQAAMAVGPIAAGENISDLDEEEDLQDDIPVDDDEDDDGLISDNYENFEDTRDRGRAKTPASPDMDDEEEIADLEESEPREELKQSALDDNVISMDHSDDIDESAPQNNYQIPDVLQESQDANYALDADSEEHGVVGDDTADDKMLAQVAALRATPRDMGQIVDDMDDMEDMDDEYPEDMSDDAVEDSVPASPSQDSSGLKQGMPLASESELVESSPEIENKRSRHDIQHFQDEEEEDLDDGDYSDGGLQAADPTVAAPRGRDLLNFNQVEKDSSIQQIKTHEDDDKFISSGSKGSAADGAENLAGALGGMSPPDESGSRISDSGQGRFGLQTAPVKDEAEHVGGETGVEASGLSPGSPESPSQPDMSEDYPDEEFEEQARPDESQDRMQIAGRGNGRRPSPPRSVAKSQGIESEDGMEEIPDDLDDSIKEQEGVGSFSGKPSLQQSSVQVMDGESYIQDEEDDNYEDDQADMADKQPQGLPLGTPSEQKSASQSSFPRLNNKDTHNQLPKAPSAVGNLLGPADDSDNGDLVDDYEEDIAMDNAESHQQSEVQEIYDEVSENEGAAAGGVDGIADDIDAYEEPYDDPFDAGDAIDEDPQMQASATRLDAGGRWAHEPKKANGPRQGPPGQMAGENKHLPEQIESLKSSKMSENIMGFKGLGDDIGPKDESIADDVADDDDPDYEF